MAWLLHVSALLSAIMFLFCATGPSDKKNGPSTNNPTPTTASSLDSSAIVKNDDDFGCDDFPVKYDDGIYYDEVKHDYLNYQYGFRIKLPKGKLARTTPCPMPQHGFSIDLSRNHESWIEVSAIYDALDLGSLDKVYKQDIDDELDGDVDCVVSRRERVKLASLSAIHYLSRWRDEHNGTPRIADTFIAMRGSQVGTIYRIYLSTSEARYPMDKRVLNQIVRHFKLTALPN